MLCNFLNTWYLKVILYHNCIYNMYFRLLADVVLKIDEQCHRVNETKLLQAEISSQQSIHPEHTLNSVTPREQSSLAGQCPLHPFVFIDLCHTHTHTDSPSRENNRSKSSLHLVVLRRSKCTRTRTGFTMET